MSKGGSSGGSGSSSTPQSQNSTSWSTPSALAQNSIDTADGNAANLYQSGGLTPYYQGQTYAGLTMPQSTAISQNYDLGIGGSTGLNTSNGTYSNIASNGVYNPANSTLSAISGGSMLNSNPATAGLTSMASGSATNPYLNSMFSQAASGVQAANDSNFNSAGRLGSGAQAFGSGQTLDNLATNLYGGAYAQNQANALAADQTLSGNYNTGVSDMLGAASQLSNNANVSASDQLSAAGGLNSNYYSQLYGANQALNASSLLQQNQQGQINANMAAYNAQTPLAALQNYEGLTSPYLNLGMSNQNNSSIGMNNTGSFQKDIGYAGSVMSLLGAVA